ncbi:MAG TPA: beta-propeller fold lactonase family protein [Gemmatimonadaceae bacterium]|nr:beta-propeller fold lactonase family protein [Gemmatimonadaceae bacterium]
MQTYGRRISTAASTTTLVLATLALGACAERAVAPLDPSLAPSASAGGRRGAESAEGPGAVYTLTNASSGNGVVAFHRAANGSLSPLGTFATGGLGAGGTLDPLVSQFATVLNERHDALFAVNAGSDQVSSFRVGADGALTLASTVSSGGSRPVSLAVHDNLLYALNTNDNTLSGFRVTGGARLVAIPNAIRSLATGADGAAAVRFTADGTHLIVSERVSNRLEVFPVNEDGRLGAPVVSASHGGAAFGFDITTRDQPIVSETQGAVSSYALATNGALTPITASISTSGAAPCWVTITSDGRFAYITNSATSTLAGFAVDAAGNLTPITPGAATGESGAGAIPIDLDHVGSRFIYTLEAGQGNIGTFVIGEGGTLTALPDVSAGAPASGMQGLAAY